MRKGISKKELFDLFYETIELCTNKTRNLSDDHIETYIFDDFYSGVISFLHENTLEDLLEFNFIDEQIFKECINLRDYAVSVFKMEGKFSIESFRKDEEWSKLIQLSEKVMSVIDNYNYNNNNNK